MPQVLDWWRIAQQCFSDDYGSLERGFLTSIFMLICGIERVFHLDEMDDPGFALLTGSPAGSPPTRQTVGAWRKHLLWNEVDRFCHRTSPWELLRGEDSLLSFDEHSIPRSHEEVFDSQRLCHHAQQIHAMREAVLRL